MLLPDKMIRYNESVISKFVPVLQAMVLNERIFPEQLYKNVKSHFSSLSEFIQTLDALYALGKVDIDNVTGEIKCL